MGNLGKISDCRIQTGDGKNRCFVARGRRMDLYNGSSWTTLAFLKVSVSLTRITCLICSTSVKKGYSKRQGPLVQPEIHCKREL